jgi:hypothetical protein
MAFRQIDNTQVNASAGSGFLSSNGSNVFFSNVTTANLAIDPTNIPTTGQSLVWNQASQKWLPGSGATSGGYFASTISNVTSYSVTTTMANAIVFPITIGYSYVVDSILITNMDTNGYSNVAVSSNILFRSGTEIIHSNVITLPYRSALELLRKPQVFNPGDALRLQGINSSLFATITYEAIASNNYISSANLITNYANTTIYNSNGYPSIIESIRAVNTAGSNAAITVRWADSTGATKTYFVFELVLPSNTVVELCENPKRLNTNDIISAYSSNPNNISVFVSGRGLY